MDLVAEALATEDKSDLFNKVREAQGHHANIVGDHATRRARGFSHKNPTSGGGSGHDECLEPSTMVAVMVEEEKV